MSSTVTVRPAKGVRGIGLFSVIAGLVLIVAGVLTWIVVTIQLSDEQITVSDDADFLAGQAVRGPFTAYAQAQVINKHALEASGGLTYAELGQDDPVRQTVMTASFLRASLFTSVVAFGVAALVIGLGVLFIFMGIALRRLAGTSQIEVTGASYSSGGDLSSTSGHRPAHAAPDAPATPAAPTAPPARPTTPPGGAPPAGSTPPSTTPPTTPPPTTPAP